MSERESQPDPDRATEREGGSGYTMVPSEPAVGEAVERERTLPGTIEKREAEAQADAAAATLAEQVTPPDPDAKAAPERVVAADSWEA